MCRGWLPRYIGCSNCRAIEGTEAFGLKAGYSTFKCVGGIKSCYAIW